LNIFAWLAEGTCPYVLPEAIAEAEKAVSLYQKYHNEDRELIGGLFNTLAYFHSYDPKDRSSFNLEASRVYLERCKEYVPRESWKPCHPEYFHTEAYLEYQEFLAGRSKGWHRDLLKDKLWQAKRQIKQAIELNEKDIYVELLTRINAEQETFGRER
jgi:hypothetical protein